MFLRETAAGGIDPCSEVWIVNDLALLRVWFCNCNFDDLPSSVRW